MRRFTARRVVATVAAIAAVGGLITISSEATAATLTCNSTKQVLRSGGRTTTMPAWNSSRIDCILGQGNAGVAVRSLQSHLNLCHGARLSIDGIYGPRTADAVRAVQRKVGVRVDGVYGPQTSWVMAFYFGTEPTDNGPIPYCVPY